jgi:hypothetical protein
LLVITRRAKGALPVIDLNALLRRRVEYYQYPWAVENGLRQAQSYLRSLFQPDDVVFVFGKSMPRSGHRFLTDCLEHYFGPSLHYCGFYSNRADCCKTIPCMKPRNAGRTNRFFLQKSHDFGFRDSPRLTGKYVIQFRSPIPRLQSNYDLSIARATGEPSKASFIAFAEKETVYFINFYRKWIAAPRPNALVIAYEDLIAHQRETLIAAIGFIQGDAAIDATALASTLERCPVARDGASSAGLRDPLQHLYADPVLFARLERQVADACGTERIRFHFL